MPMRRMRRRETLRHRVRRPPAQEGFLVGDLARLAGVSIPTLKHLHRLLQREYELQWRSVELARADVYSRCEPDGCGEPLQALLGCTERAPACAGSCKVEGDAFSACLQGYCAGHSNNVGCAVVAATFQRK